MKHAVKVTIVDEEFTVRSELDPEYARQVAAHVDAAIRRVLASGQIVESHKAAILAALAITDELFQSRGQQQELAARLKHVAGELARLLPPQKRQSQARLTARRPRRGGSPARPSRAPERPQRRRSVTTTSHEAVRRRSVYMITYLEVLAGLVIAAVVGVTFFYAGRSAERRAAARARASAESIAERILTDARRDAESFRNSLVLAGKEELEKARTAFEADVARRHEEVGRVERRLEEREGTLERKIEVLERRGRELDQRLDDIAAREQRVAGLETELRGRIAEQSRRLETLAGMTASEAKKELVRAVEDEARAEAAALVRTAKEQAKREADREARKIIALAIQRVAADHTAETTTAAVALQNDEMKGRIIGREGRNIRAFETATGVDVIIDDTPDTVVISCFDPVRREVARLALERLITDGRIHPGRIEEVVRKAQADVDQQIQEAGEQAVYDVGVHGMHAELVKLVGRMKFRTSYGQNLLKHTKETCWLAGIMAAELKLDVALAKRGALLHDIGKVLTHESEGTHVQLGVEMARKYGEQAVVINCIEAHHDDVPHESPISVIVQAADAISGSRPGARREAFESYVKRLTKLEEIANGFKGVEKTFAIQAGREIRVVVTPEQVDDARAAQLSDEIARRIENELQYPGQIKVVVVRETRAVDFAR